MLLLLLLLLNVPEGADKVAAMFFFLINYYIIIQDGGKSLQEGMEENTTIRTMDLRLTEVGQESEYCINQLLKRNRETQYKQNSV